MFRRTMELRPYQRDGLNQIHDAWRSGVRNVLAVYPTGSGKCLGKGTPVLMFDGTVRAVETIQPGEILMGPDSSPRMVMTTCTGREMMYRIVPVKGDPYTVNESHVLSLKTIDRITAPDGQKYSTGDIVNITVRDYLRSNKTFRHCTKGWRVPVEFTTKPIDSVITPYILGVWLGDGNSRGTRLHNVDPEVQKEWSDYAASIGCQVNVLKVRDRIDTHSLVGCDESNRFQKELRRLNLLQNKHIPQCFKAASFFDRLHLLAGILDTDGHLSHSGYDAVFKQEQLAKDTAFVARSLGLAAYVTECRKTCTNTGATGTYWRLYISGHTSMIPCRVARRKAQPRQQVKSVLVTGISVEPIGEGEYFGFEIMGPDRLFLLGDFTVTHNTVLFSEVIRQHQGASCAIAHRQELVGQIAMALARDEVKHRIIGPKDVIKSCIQAQLEELGRDYYDPSARCAVAGVDTIIRRGPELKRWADQVTLWVCDEAHHLSGVSSTNPEGNKWCKAVALFPNARGLGVTATPERADGKGLGRGMDGLFDTMIVGPSMRELINMGYLTDYRVICPPSDLDLSTVATGNDGDYIRGQLALTTRKSSVMGDVVQHYLTLAQGKLGVTFAPDVETASELSNRFNVAGVPSEVVSAKTPDRIRREILKRFRKRQIHQLVNVDLFGEGFDLPAIEVVSMARATQSFSLYCQQWGRALRLMDGKEKAIIIDHVGNLVRFNGPPDRPRAWSLDRRERRTRSTIDPDVIPMRVCTNPVCMAPYEAVHPACPFCGQEPMRTARSAPEFVEGDLYELDAATLAAMRGEIARIERDPDAIHQGLLRAGEPAYVARAAAARHGERLRAQGYLKDAIALWAGYRYRAGDTDRMAYRRFYHQFGTDVLSAQTLGRADAETLALRLYADMWRAAR